MRTSRVGLLMYIRIEAALACVLFDSDERVRRRCEKRMRRRERGSETEIYEYY